MGAKRVGQRIHVYWTDETAWFSGVVQEFDATQGYYVLYDDGDERWEGLNESYRFEGQQGSDEEEDGEEEEDEGADQQESQHVEEQSAAVEARNASSRGATPRATEPPGSEEEEDDDGQVDGRGEDEEQEGDATLEADDDERSMASSRSNGYPKPVVLEAREDTASEAEDDEGEDSRSVALTDVPTTYEPRRVSSQQAVTATSATRNQRSLPQRGILRGFVARALELPLINRKDEPSACVRVAFVEAGAGEAGRLQASALMMRCKQALSATQLCSETANPVWNDEDRASGEDSTEIWADSQSLDGLFQLQVAPPLVVSAHQQQAAWSQLKGNLLFSLYHNGVDESRRSEFIGQASLPLARIMRELLATQATSRFIATTQYLPLETRQGKPLHGAQGEIPELVVRFQFEAQFAPDVRRPKEPTTNTTPVEEIRQPATTRAGSSSSTRSPSVAASSSTRPKSATASTNARAGAKRHQSSSEINRRKFEKQLELENRAMARRVAEQRKEAGAIAARRQQLNHQPPLKCEPKAPGVLAVAPATVKRSHKASSQINRGKFHDELKRENKAMGKRLIERVGGSLKAEKQRPQQTNDELHWDDAKAQDKAYVADKRHVVRQEKDYLLEKAQAKYQQQNELVEQVMALQEQVSDWKTKLFTVKSSLQRVEAMNKKDSHVRDCLRSAVERDAKRRPGVAIAPLSTAKGNSRTAELERFLDEADEDDDDSAAQKLKDELRELLQESLNLESEKQRLDDQVNALSAQETTLEDEILALHRKWQFVQTKRAFQAKMAKDRATPASAAYAAQEMKAKKLMMEMKAKKLMMDLTPEEEEQYKIFTAQEELTQLQLAVAVLRDRLEKGESGPRPTRQTPSSSSSAACEYLREKITKRKTKIEKLEREQEDWRRRYEELVVNGEYDRLRAQAQELQHLLFLCQSEAKHVAAAERVAKHSKDKLSMELQKQRFQDQTETEILLKKKATPRAARE